MITLFDRKQDCCGCTACRNICPNSAIHMKPDEEGFLYPFIKEESCVNCELCKKVCAFQSGYDISCNFDIPYVYAVKHRDEKVRLSSTSGGAFTALSDYILSQNGIIYGVKFDEQFNIIHSKAVTKEERDNFKGSKYVQSDLKDSFIEIKSLLKEGKYILFTGTPCQVSGLKSYLKNINMEKLFLCDIVCHGTPSPLMWKEHIKYTELKKKSKIINYYCRSKIKGWHGHNELNVFKNGLKDYKSSLSQKHKILFYSHNILRPSCHICKYTNLHRPSDITIADFWGIEKCMSDFDDNKGVSLILINTIKGKDLFNKIKNELDYMQSDIKSCLQPQLQYPNKASPMRDMFWEDYKKFGYIYIIKKYAN